LQFHEVAKQAKNEKERRNDNEKEREKRYTVERIPASLQYLETLRASRIYVALK
jgi:hypothetical protein